MKAEPPFGRCHGVGMKKILIGAPVRQEAAILREFLRSLRELDRSGLSLEFVFVDDNVDPASTELLREFAAAEPTLLVPAGETAVPYHKDEFGHAWNDELIWKVATFKDRILEHALAAEHDGVFLIDSDLVLHQHTLQRLIAQGVDIVAEVFWTRWQPDSPERPQVWLRDQYSMHQQRRDEQLPTEEIERRRQGFLQLLRVPGLHEVGGLGACTLISVRAIRAGVRFAAIPNLGFWGEDRHFCIRAGALGLRLHAETSLPPLHVYRPSELERVEPFRAERAQQGDMIAALDACRAALATWGTSHYLTTNGTEGHELLATALRATLQPGAAARAEQARRTRCVARTHVVQATPEVRGADTVEVRSMLVREGSTLGQAYADHLAATATMVREDDAWRIADLQLQRVEPPFAVPVVRKTHGNRVLLSLLVKNEAGRFLPEVLTHAASCVDHVLIVDDGSSDDTVALCRHLLRRTPHTIVELGTSTFHDEHRLRRQQWELARSLRPDWVLCLDADEVFEPRMTKALRSLVDQDSHDAVAFRLFDFWDQDHYRDDALWSAHRTFRPFLVRVLPTLTDDFQRSAQHCGRWPLAASLLRTALSDVRLKHLGWSRPDDRRRKYERYQRLDPNGQHGSRAQYASILDPAPRLVRWQA
jgi:glycosyltransferase involved in cell wall biosynthesis